jgi:hypothetical protein
MSKPMDEFEIGLSSLSNQYGRSISGLKSTVESQSYTLYDMTMKIDDLSKQLTISNRKVDMLELRLEGKLSNEEYKRLQSMYASADTENHYLADQAVKSLKENL